MVAECLLHHRPNLFNKDDDAIMTTTNDNNDDNGGLESRKNLQSKSISQPLGKLRMRTTTEEKS